MASRARSKFGACMFKPVVFRKQVCCIEESTCDIVGTFRRPHQRFGVLVVIRRPGNYAPPSGVANPKFGGGQKILRGAKMLDFRRITLFCLEKRLSKHKMTMFSKHFGGPSLLCPPWLRLCAPAHPSLRPW